MPRLIIAEIVLSLAVFALQSVPRGAGLRTLGLVVVIVALVPWLVAQARRQAVPAQRADRVLIAAILGLGALQLAFAVVRTVKPKVLDIAVTTVAAIIALAHGSNPYVVAVDPLAGGIADAGAFHGYKYLPVMMAAYAPLVLAFGLRGTVITNLLLQGGVAAALRSLAARVGGRTAGLLAATLYLSLPFVAFQLFTRGVNDAVPVLALLGALLLLEERPGCAGLLVGLSIAAKLMPGLAALACLVPAAGGRRQFTLGVAAGLMPILPFALAAPGAFADNILLFNLFRPVDNTSWLFGLPIAVAMLARGAAMAALTTLYVWVWRRAPGLDQRCAAAAIAILLVFAVGPDMHHNYFLWFIPFLAVLAARAATGRSG
jgi:hypothetical protein